MSIADLTKEQQFQAFAMRRTIDHKVVHPKKMLDDFTVKVLIESLAKISNERRADLVQLATGMKRGSALKLTIEKSIEAIELALTEEDTDADELFTESKGGIKEDEIIRFFPPDRVFNTWFYSGFITAEGPEDKSLMADLWDFILEHKLLGDMTALQLAQDLGLHHFVSDKCPAEKRNELLKAVLTYGEPMLAPSRADSSSANANRAKPFTAVALFSVVKPSDLVKFIPLTVMAKPLEELAKTKGWIKPMVEVPLPPPSSGGSVPPENGLPPEALDSVAPPKGDDMPEIEVSSDAGGGELTLDVDMDDKRPSITDDPSDEPTVVASVDEVTGKKGGKPKGPPPLGKR